MHQQGESLFGRPCSQGQYELEEGLKPGIKGAQSMGQEDPLEEEMATHASILVWRIPRIEEPGGLQSMGSQRVEHN